MAWGAAGWNRVPQSPCRPTCPLCSGLVYANEPCGRCFAPAEVIDSIRTRDRPPSFIGVLGPSGVGKTVYLGMLLDLLARGAGGLSGLARGPFSVALHRTLVLALERQRFPDDGGVLVFVLAKSTSQARAVALTRNLWSNSGMPPRR